MTRMTIRTRALSADLDTLETHTYVVGRAGGYVWEIMPDGSRRQPTYYDGTTLTADPDTLGTVIRRWLRQRQARARREMSRA